MTDSAALTRRSLLIAGSAGSAIALAACAPSDGGSKTDTGTGKPSEVATLSEVPVGGAIAVMFNGAQIIVSQPQEGTVVAFSAVCTHQGCIIQPEKKGLNCPCHSSLFDTATGEVLQGPATKPLPAVKVAVQGDKVIAG